MSGNLIHIALLNTTHFTVNKNTSTYKLKIEIAIRTKICNKNISIFVFLTRMHFNCFILNNIRNLEYGNPFISMIIVFMFKDSNIFSKYYNLLDKTIKFIIQNNSKEYLKYKYINNKFSF